MSKNIPKPIIAVGFSTKKKNSKIDLEIDFNRINNLNSEQYNELLNILTNIRSKVVHISNENNTPEEKERVYFQSSSLPDFGVPTIAQLNAIKMLMKDGRKLQAVKDYKQIVGCGLREAKEWVERELSNHI